jgi:basic membrane protein A
VVHRFVGNHDVDDTATSVASASSPSSAALATDEPTELRSELDTTVAATPLVFAPGSSELPDGADSILTTIASALSRHPDIDVTIVGHGDGPPLSDLEGLGVLRAERVRAALGASGAGAGRLSVAGAAAAGDVPAPTGLGGHIGFAVPGAAEAADVRLRLVLLSPFAADDRPETRAMVNAVGAVDAGRGDIEAAITTGVADPAQLVELAGQHAGEGAELVIIHGVALDDALLAVVTSHPGTTFALGPAPEGRSVTPRNLYSYDVAAEQGGYVLGALAAQLSSSRRIAVVGGASRGDQQRFADAFHDAAGAEAEDVEVAIELTGSDSDAELAAELARHHLSEGSDVLTGTGAVDAAVDEITRSGALWLGNAVDLRAEAADRVAASQVYHWEVSLAAIIADLEAGGPDGRELVLTLANGGLEISYDDELVPAGVRTRGEELTAAITEGALVVE